MSNAFARYDELHALPALSGVSYWRQTFTKFFLLALGLFLLVRLACLLLRTGARTGTAYRRDQKRRNQNRPGKQLFHTETEQDHNQDDQSGNLSSQMFHASVKPDY
jgi:hypothetical protein